MARVSGTQRGSRALLVATLGFGLGLGGTWLVFGRPAGTSGQVAQPSVTEFGFPAAAPNPLAPNTAADSSSVGVELPTDPVSAVGLVLRSLASGDPAGGYPFLDDATRRRWPTPAAWVAAQSDRPAITAFEVLGSRTVEGEATGVVTVTVRATHQPRLDPFSGLVPAATEQVWTARLAGATWLVDGVSPTSRFLVPSDEAAPDVVRAWLDAQLACDSGRAAHLQASSRLSGTADLPGLPCAERGSWTVGQVTGLDALPAAAALVAAYGPEVGQWARAVPMSSPLGRVLWATVAPLGESWRLVGLTAA